LNNCPRLFATVEMMFICLLQRDSDAYAVLHIIVRSTLWYDTVTNFEETNYATVSGRGKYLNPKSPFQKE